MRDDAAAPMTATAGRLVVISGPSGVGKGAVLDQLRHRIPDLWVSTSVTTRPPRPGEVDAERYRFVDDESFDQLVDHGDLLEWNEFDRHRYGTPRAPVLKRLADGELVILELDPIGALRLRRTFPAARLIFLAPPSWEELTRRLAKRGTESGQVIRRRLAIARNELRLEPRFDRVLVNDSLDSVVRDLVPELLTSHAHE